MRVQHRQRRRGLYGDPGTIIVGETKYVLDEEGIVEVSDEHGQTMLQGANWIEASRTAKAGQPGAMAGDFPPPPSVDREREELLKRATELGLAFDRRLAKHKLAALIAAAEERNNK